MTTEADALKGKYFRVLDDGFVGFVDYMGNDDAIDQAARVSYGTGTRKVSDRRTLELKFHIRIPMDAHRQLVR
jgi:thymidylate synthase (FAD)